MLPACNRNFGEIPENARGKLDFTWLERVDEAVAATLEDKPAEVPEAAEWRERRGSLEGR